MRPKTPPKTAALAFCLALSFFALAHAQAGAGRTAQGREAERAAFVENLLKSYGSVEVRRDSAGNVVATRKGTGGGPLVVMDAHLDTVFQEGLKIKAELR